MTPQQIDLVRSSFARVAPIADAAGGIVLRKLFGSRRRSAAVHRDIRSQGAKLMLMIATPCACSTGPKPLLPVLPSFGVRHAGYGVQAADYRVVGLALMSTLEEGLGDTSMPETRSAWACGVRDRSARR